ncbi:MAG: RDD family protein [Nitrospirae bacterium]|nr:RDD family protein [Nitrospirota bacterium]
MGTDVLEKVDRLLIVLKMPGDTAKASLLLRVLAKLVDLIIIAAAIKTVPQVGYFAGLVYLLISDGLFDGRSLGKKIIRLRVISPETGTPSTFRDSMVRNSTFALSLLLYKIPLLGWVFVILVFALEFLLMLGNEEGLRLGDNLANTKVVEG